MPGCFTVVVGDVTKLFVDAAVNVANESREKTVVRSI